MPAVSLENPPASDLTILPPLRRAKAFLRECGSTDTDWLAALLALRAGL